MSKELFVNKKVWLVMTDRQRNAYVKRIFEHYRANGFPYFPKEKAWREKELSSLRNYDFKKIIGNKKNKTLAQTMHGLALTWSFMPHAYNVKCSGKLSPLEVFNDDVLFKKVIEKRLVMGDNMSDSGIRKMLKLISNAQGVSGFRPTAAAALYSMFTKEGDTVLDMSAGFGGRMLGAYLNKLNYIGVEPSTKTFNGLNRLASFLNYDATLYKIGSEDLTGIHLEEGGVDFAFTSPPYFDLEQYSNEKTQSYKKFTDKYTWVWDYLGATFSNTQDALKYGGYMAINIANTKNFPDLEEETINVAKACGFKHRTTWKLALSNPNFKNGKSAFKFEPIFIFQRN